MNILEAQNISKSYAGHTALNDVSISIPNQSIFGLLGPNGAGKTTLIRIINQIIEPDQGSITINGEALNQNHIGLIGYLPEERGLYKKMKVGEQLIYLAQLRGLPTKEAKEKSKFWIKKLGLSDWWGKKVEDLSKGMAQKVQFASTVLHEPELIILDEPFSGFDPVNANLIKDEILELRDKGCTIIFSTHRMESVEQLCDHVAMINQSEKILDGKKSEVKAAFKKNVFLLKHKGSFSLEENGVTIESQEILEDDYYETKLKMDGAHAPNELIQKLLSKTEIHGFIEEEPSINDIFIEKVEGGNHE